MVRKEDNNQGLKTYIEKNIRDNLVGAGEAVKSDLDTMASEQNERKSNIDDTAQFGQEHNPTPSNYFTQEVADMHNEKDASHTQSLANAVVKAVTSGRETFEIIDYNSLEQKIIRASSLDRDLRDTRRALVERSENLQREEERLSELKSEDNTVMQEIISLIQDLF